MQNYFYNNVKFSDLGCLFTVNNRFEDLKNNTIKGAQLPKLYMAILKEFGTFHQSGLWFTYYEIEPESLCLGTIEAIIHEQDEKDTFCQESD